MKAKEDYKVAIAKYNEEQKTASSPSSKSKPIKEALSKSPKTSKPSTTSPSKFKSKEFIESSEDSSSEEDDVSLQTFVCFIES